MLMTLNDVSQKKPYQQDRKFKKHCSNICRKWGNITCWL